MTTGRADATDRPVAAWLATAGAALDPALVRAWLDDSLRLAAAAPGDRARAIAETPLLVGVYRELETIERETRAALLRASARVFARAAPGTLGAASLDLLAPFALHARRCVARSLARETERGVSERLLRPEGASPTGVPGLAPDADGAAHGWIEGLARLALALESGAATGETAEGRLVALEVRLALDDPRAAYDGLVGLAGELRDAAARSRDDATVALDAAERASVAAAFALGDDGAVLLALESGVLAFDRSASAGALHAAARHRVGRGARVERAALCDDGFLAPTGGEERARIARFLAARAPREPAPARPSSPPRRRRGAWT